MESHYFYEWLCQVELEISTRKSWSQGCVAELPMLEDMDEVDELE